MAITATDRQAMRLAVRAYDDFQDSRKSMCNRLKIKKDGSPQKNRDENWMMSETDMQFFTSMKNVYAAQEKAIDKKVSEWVKKFQIHTEYLSGIVGVAHRTSAVLISEIDIEIADTASKIWKYAGLSPCMTRGKACVDIKDVNGRKILRTYKNNQGKKKAVVLTETMIRADRLTKGFLSPFNKYLRTYLNGVLGPSFYKQGEKSYYAQQFYYPYKARLKNSEKLVEVMVKGGDTKMIPWKEASDAHHNNAAVRYMIKMFIVDLHKAWREIEGLPVRGTYLEEYLGHTHT